MGDLAGRKTARINPHVCVAPRLCRHLTLFLGVPILFYPSLEWQLVTPAASPGRKTKAQSWPIDSSCVNWIKNRSRWKSHSRIFCILDRKPRTQKLQARRVKTKTFVENALCSIKRIARKGERERAAFSRVESMMSWQREFLAKEQEMMLEV